MPEQARSFVVPICVHGTEHCSSVSCRPLVASEVSRFAVDPVVVRVTEPKDSVSLERLSTMERCTVSPGTRPVAATDSARTPAAEVSTTLPLLTLSLAEVVEVNEPNVPRPATDAAVPTRTTEARTLPAVVLIPMRIAVSFAEDQLRGARAGQLLMTRTLLRRAQVAAR